MQPIALAQFYKKIWPGVEIIEIDNQRRNQLAQVIDIGGADKILRFYDGGIAFLAQRFRRFDQTRYDDLTLRYSRPSGIATEWDKFELALKRCGFIAGYYAYGHANESECGFLRMRIIKLQELIRAIADGILVPKIRSNINGSSIFLAIPFKAIPKEFFEYDYAENKSLKLL